MTILLFTDASTKNGVSCWAYRSSLDEEVITGIYLTSNSAAMEILAIIKGLESLPRGSEVLVVSDFLSAVRTITNYKQDPTYKGNSDNICDIMRGTLKKMLKYYTVDAIWVASKCPTKRHVEVDQMSKTMLQDYLNESET